MKLQAKTEEQRLAIEKKFANNICMAFGGEPFDGLHIDDFITFDQMAEIVDYLRSSDVPNKELFEECWVAYHRKGSKKKAFEYWKKLTEKEKNQVIAHIKAYVENRELKYQKDFERYLRDKTFQTIVVSDKGCVYDPAIIDTKDYIPRGYGIYYDEQNACYGYTSMYFDGDVVFDGYDNDTRPNGAKLMLNNGRGVIMWDSSTKIWNKI